MTTVDAASVSYLLAAATVEAFRIVLDSSCIQHATLLSLRNSARRLVDLDMTASILVGDFNAHVDRFYHGSSG